MDADTKAKMLKAKKLIEAHEIDSAVTILSGINHPTAKAWLKKLDVPPEKNIVIERLKVMGVIIVVLFIAVVAALLVFQYNQDKGRGAFELTATSVRLFLDSIATETPAP